MDDLLELLEWINGQAGIEIAEDYTTRIEAFADQLLTFPRRGTPRGDVSSGLRSITYRKRTIIFYRICDNIPEVVGLSHGGRSLGNLFLQND